MVLLSEDVSFHWAGYILEYQCRKCGSRDWDKEEFGSRPDRGQVVQLFPKSKDTSND
jgi:hypothetical protein